MTINKEIKEFKELEKLVKLKEKFSFLTEKKDEDVKWCKGCNEVKDVNEFYKQTNKKYLQTYCKKCSNADRYKYKRKKVEYKSKKKTFFDLHKEIQESILYDLHVKKTKKSITTKNNINYQRFLRWVKKDTFPKY
jgi:RNase P subunit RPR2